MGRVRLPASNKEGIETMKTTMLKTELSNQESKDMIVITEKEARTIRALVTSLNNQLSALDHVLDSIGIDSWVSSDHPRTLANYKFTIKEE
tara:strand:+ start:361 stop:633 length:273 start_codon:yes stop_codon:yes gene_type:complete